MLYGWTPTAAWHFLISSASLATLIGCGAVAIAVLTPPLVARFIPNLRVTAICVAAAAFYSSFVAGKFYDAGLKEKQSEWDISLQVEAHRGEAARTDAESAIRIEPPDSVRNDPRNRDNWKRPGSK